MTAEKFHDALTLLPLDLVAEADRARQSPRKRRRHWGHYCALAASLTVVMLCGWFINEAFHAGSKSTDTALTNEAAIQLPAPGAASGNADPADRATPEDAPPEKGELYPGIALLAPVENLPDTNSAVNTSAPPPVRLLTGPEELPEGLILSENWFDSHDLLLFHFSGFPECPQLLDIQAEENVWYFLFPASGGEIPAGKDWYLPVSVEKGLIAENAQLQVIFE